MSDITQTEAYDYRVTARDKIEKRAAQGWRPVRPGDGDSPLVTVGPGELLMRKERPAEPEPVAAEEPPAAEVTLVPAEVTPETIVETPPDPATPPAA